MTSRTPLPASLDLSGFRVADALASGVSPGRLRALDLERTFHGSRAASSDSLHALRPLMSPYASFAGPTAARLWDLPLPLAFVGDRRIHVSHLGNHRMRRPGVVSSRRATGAHVDVDGLPVLDPVSTWVSLAAALGRDDLTAVADRLVSGTLKTKPLCKLSDLDRALDSVGAIRGIARLRAARAQTRVGAWSRTETLLRLVIVGAGLPEPELNLRVWFDAVEFAIVDLAWPDMKIALEYDGRWHDDAGRKDADWARHERLVDCGWLVVRIRAQDLFDNPSLLIARLVRRLRDRGHVLPGSIGESRLTGPRR